MDIQIKTYVGKEVDDLSLDTLQSIACCYKEVFNQSWQDGWTNESAFHEVKHSLMVSKYRKPILVLAFLEKQVIGFSWLIMTSSKYVNNEDMPFSLADKQKKAGVEVIRYWLKIAKQDKLLIYRELGIKKEYLKNGHYMSSKLMMPMAQAAVDNGYGTLFYWTNPSNVTFEHCLGLGWHPIYFYPKEDRLIMKGSASSLIEFSKGFLDRDEEIFRKMNVDIKKYFCR